MTRVGVDGTRETPKILELVLRVGIVHKFVIRIMPVLSRGIEADRVPRAGEAGKQRVDPRPLTEINEQIEFKSAKYSEGA
jgi:hypothetical protein